MCDWGSLMDDLSRLLVQQPQPGARFGQGTLRAWNPATFEHVIEWRGLRITDATILAGVDALTWQPGDQVLLLGADQSGRRDRKSTRLNSSHVRISYAVFCLKKKRRDDDSVA